MKFSELVNLEELKELCESFTALIRIGTGIQDTDGRFLITSGQQIICTKSHSVNPVSSFGCAECDMVVAGQFSEGQQFNIYKCKNGLVNVAVPIVIDGQKLATLFAGQFFLSPQEQELFTRQARDFGLAGDSTYFALSRAPVYSEERAKDTIAIVMRLTQLVGQMGLQRQRLVSANVNLQKEATEHLKAEEELRESEERFRLLFENSSVGKALTAPDGKILKVNQACANLIGYTIEELLTKNVFQITHKDDVDSTRSRMQTLLKKEEYSQVLKKRYIHKAGNAIWAETTANLLRDEMGEPLYFIANIVDITDRQKAEESLLKSLKEKDTLIKEINHRVKNNMMVIIGLLGLQESALKSEELKNIFSESMHRIESMALVHEMLYQTKDFTNINYKEYIQKLVNALMVNYNAEGRGIKAKLKIEDVPLDIEAAVPCGLIINELVSNSFKYAFLGKASGEIFIEFNRINNRYCLKVKDDGIGLPANFNSKQIKTLGLQLVQILTKQLGGDLSFSSEGGTETKITFLRKERRLLDLE